MGWPLSTRGDIESGWSQWTPPAQPRPKSAQRWIRPLELVAITGLLLLVWARRVLEIAVLQWIEHNSPGADVSGLQRTRPYPFQFDVAVSLALLAAGACAIWTWRRAAGHADEVTAGVRRIVIVRQAVVGLIAAIVAVSFATWGTQA